MHVLYISAPPPAPLQLDIEFISYDTIQHENFEFNINGSDVIVFLHVQKTGGTTFEKHLVNDIDLESPCLCRRKPKKHRKKHNHQRNNINNKSQRRSLMAMTADLENNQRKKRKLKCDCFRPNGKMSNWLFSRYNIGWKCGLHPDWTELTECVDDKLNSIDNTIMRRRYFYITMLRDPVRRYLSGTMIYNHMCEFLNLHYFPDFRAAVLTRFGSIIILPSYLKNISHLHFFFQNSNTHKGVPLGKVQSICATDNLLVVLKSHRATTI